MKQLGATKKESSQEENKSGVILGRFKELGEYHHRCLLGPKRRESITYPTFRENFETQELEPSFNTIVLPPMNSGIKTIIDKLESIDRKNQLDHGVPRDAQTSFFSRGLRMIYIVLSRDLDNDGKPWIGPWEYPTTVSKNLNKLQFENATKDKSKLRYGPYWTWDLIIQKYEDQDIARKTTDKRRTIKYTSNVDPECMALAGKVPMGAVYEDDFFIKNPELLEHYYKEVFTPEEIDAINLYDKTLEDFVIPVKDDEDIVKVLNQFPFNLDAKDENGNNLVRFKDELRREIEKYGIRLLESNANSLPEHTEEAKIETSEPVKEDAKIKKPKTEIDSDKGW